MGRYTQGSALLGSTELNSEQTVLARLVPQGPQLVPGDAQLVPQDTQLVPSEAWTVAEKGCRGGKHQDGQMQDSSSTRDRGMVGRVQESMAHLSQGYGEEEEEVSDMARMQALVHRMQDRFGGQTGAQAEIRKLQATGPTQGHVACRALHVIWPACNVTGTLGRTAWSTGPTWSRYAALPRRS